MAYLMDKVVPDGYPRLVRKNIFPIKSAPRLCLRRCQATIRSFQRLENFGNAQTINRSRAHKLGPPSAYSALRSGVLLFLCAFYVSPVDIYQRTAQFWFSQHCNENPHLFASETIRSEKCYLQHSQYVEQVFSRGNVETCILSHFGLFVHGSPYHKCRNEHDPSGRYYLKIIGFDL